MNDRIKGTVKFFNDVKGFGFINREDGGKDVFVHSSQLDNLGGTLNEGQTVSFEARQGQKGLEAVNVSTD